MTKKWIIIHKSYTNSSVFDGGIMIRMTKSGDSSMPYRRNWEMIIEQLKRDHTKIHVINRAQGRYSVLS